MNKADGQDTAGRLSAIVANSLDTPAKTQDLARQAYQSRTQFHRLFHRGRRNSGSHATTAVAGKSSISTGAFRNVGHRRRPGRRLRLVGGVHARFPKSLSDFSQPLPAHA